jgi:transcriptional regulator
MVHPWDGAVSEDEWRAWLAAGRDFGQLVVADPDGWPAVVPTHFTVDDGHTVLVHLARPNPVWRLIEAQPRVVLTVVDDYAYVPKTWRAGPGSSARDGVPTSYYAAVQLRCQAEIVDDPDGKAELLRRQLRFLQPGQEHAPVSVDDPPVRPAAAGHPGAASARRRRRRQVQVRRSQARGTPARRRRPTAAARPGPRPRRPRRAAAPTPRGRARVDVTSAERPPAPQRDLAALLRGLASAAAGRRVGLRHRRALPGQPATAGVLRGGRGPVARRAPGAGRRRRPAVRVRRRLGHPHRAQRARRRRAHRHVAGQLAGAEISCKVIAARHHDHLLVPYDRAQQALDLLQQPHAR